MISRVWFKKVQNRSSLYITRDCNSNCRAIILLTMRSICHGGINNTSALLCYQPTLNSEVPANVLWSLLGENRWILASVMSSVRSKQKQLNFSLHTHTHTHTHIYIYVYIYILHLFIYTYIYIYIGHRCVHTHTHAHTYIDFYSINYIYIYMYISMF